MNLIFLALIVIAVATAAIREIQSTDPDEQPMQALSEGAIDAAGSAVELALGLVGVMALFLGLMKIAEAGGLLTVLARLLRPLMVRLFPSVPPEHPAMGAMILNFSANILGLGNAATPFGIRAMQELDKLNPHPGTATNAMALFLAINTSSITLLPTGVIALRASLGSEAPAAILPTTLFATLFATIAGITSALILQRYFRSPPPTRAPDADSPSTDETSEREGTMREDGQEGAPEPSAQRRTQDDRPSEQQPMNIEVPSEGYPAWVSVLVLLGVLAIIPLTIVYGQAIAPWIIPGLVVGFLSYGVIRGVPVYEVFVEGAKEGFNVALRIIPYLVAILVAVGMLRESGALGMFVGLVGPLTTPFGLPAEALPMALLRPLSGSGAYGIMAGIMQDPATGPDTHVGILVSTLQGSTETTFYVLAVYFGAIGVKRVRHTLAAALSADAVAVIAAVTIVAILYL
ncbi:nucleoside recognition domain protein [Thioalkalivibrio sp. K90mix]|uniref:nucleoside recognition domain-containing protein n=1 Tax=Thioalkalivibrio sp. (strain K90mix) TaxID=396595 RepID=UPI000195A7FE|nr:nucleoside recognition domain-containing protein [Thioalkalivibrio sp. K90mix]ADC71024.1 nucleoside recognition domain protein [Thioalkalivibrio sp. K90mix]